MDKKTFLALTIGPIIKTMSMARRTREIWVSSYMFSSLMGHLVEALKTKGHIILPSLTSKDSIKGAGIYPDRLIMFLEKTDENIDEYINESIKSFCKKYNLSATGFINSINIHHVCIREETLDAMELKDDKGNVLNSNIHKLNHLLNIKELNPGLSSCFDNFSKDLFKNALGTFYNEAFGTHKKSFSSVLEIAARDKNLSNEDVALFYEDVNDDEKQTESKEEKRNAILQTLNKNQKYIAIVHADGDNFADLISNMGNKYDDIIAFSEKLAEFSCKAAELIDIYGGQLVYAGGDDLLFFAPLVFKGKTIFGLINELNKLFSGTFNDTIYQEAKVSISFGISLTYYKYPMHEALSLSRDLLFKTAKKTEGKNAVAIQLLLHSGQSHQTIMKLGQNSSFQEFMNMTVDFDTRESILQSLVHILVEDRELLKLIIGNNERLAGYFQNHFSTDDKRSETGNFITAVRNSLEFTCKLYKTNPQSDDCEEKAIQHVHTICRFIKILNNDEQ